MRRLIIGLTVLMLAGCATPYQQGGFRGGVVATPIAGDMYRVSARGNGFTDPARIEDFVLLRAAETALDQGFDYFIVLSQEDRTRNLQFTTPGSATTQTNMYGSAYTMGNSTYGSMQGSSTTTYSPPTTQNVIKPGSDVMIQLLREPAPGAFPAAEIIANIGPRYGLGSQEDGQ